MKIALTAQSSMHAGMESLAPPTLLATRKWLLCLPLIFIVYIFLSCDIFQTSFCPISTTIIISATFDNHHSLPSSVYNFTGTTQIDNSSPNYINKVQSIAASQPSTAIAVSSSYLSPDTDQQVVQMSPSPSPSVVVASVQELNKSRDVSVLAHNFSIVSLQQPYASKEIENQTCDIFDGNWVHDRKAYPLYRAHWCPFLSDQVICQKNGRPDFMYEQWRWQPNACNIPRFNGRYVLEKWRGKRVVIVGDSLNRNMWESLACLLYSSVPRKKAYFNVRSSQYKIFKALEYNCLVEFYWSPFLVELKEREDRAKILRLDNMAFTARQWLRADILIFNTGHWWTHNGKTRAWNFFERRGHIMNVMEGNEAFNQALRTWARWLDRNVDPTKTTVVFRSISPEHKRQNLHWCYNQTHPITKEPYIQLFPKSMVSLIERTIQRMKTPVKYLNITKLSEFRRDAHTSIYTTRGGKLLTLEQRNQPMQHADCSHWCLPGLPDTWNVLLFAILEGTCDVVS